MRMDGARGFQISQNGVTRPPVLQSVPLLHTAGLRTARGCTMTCSDLGTCRVGDGGIGCLWRWGS
jgi:hypothetical protein